MQPGQVNFVSIWYSATQIHQEPSEANFGIAVFWPKPWAFQRYEIHPNQMSKRILHMLDCCQSAGNNIKVLIPQNLEQKPPQFAPAADLLNP